MSFDSHTMAGLLEHSCQNGGTQLTDVLPLVIGYLQRAKSVVVLLATSRSIGDICTHALAGNIHAGSALLLGVLDINFSSVLVLSEVIENGQLAEWNLWNDSYASQCPWQVHIDVNRVCRAEISWVLSECGNAMLQDESFSAQMAAVCARHLNSSSERGSMTYAAAEVFSCLLVEGGRLPFSQLLAAHRSGHDDKGYAAWMTAHSKHSMTLAFNDEDFVPYGIPNDHDNQQAITAAVTAIQENDVGALGTQLGVLGVSPLLILDLIAISGKLSPHADSVNKYLSDLIAQTVDSDGLVTMMLQGLRNGCPVLTNLIETAATMGLPATSQQLRALLNEMYYFPNEISRLLNESPAFDGPYGLQLFNRCSGEAIAEVMGACLSGSYPYDSSRYILDTLCSTVNRSHGHLVVSKYIMDTLCSTVNRSQGHLVISRTTIKEMLTDVICDIHNTVHQHGMSFHLRLLLSDWCGLLRYKLRVRYVRHCIKLITSLCSLPAANDLLAEQSIDLLLQLLTAVAAPGSSAAFLPAFKLILRLAQGKHNISPELAARIYARAKATQLDSSSVSVAMAVVVLELPVLQRVNVQLSSEVQVLDAHEPVDAEVPYISSADAVADSMMESALEATADSAAESASDATAAGSGGGDGGDDEFDFVSVCSNDWVDCEDALDDL